MITIIKEFNRWSRYDIGLQTYQRNSSKSLNLSRAEKEQERAVVNDNARLGPGAEKAESPHDSSLPTEGPGHVCC